MTRSIIRISAEGIRRLEEILREEDSESTYIRIAAAPG